MFIVAINDQENRAVSLSLKSNVKRNKYCDQSQESEWNRKVTANAGIINGAHRHVQNPLLNG